jgi:Tyrosine phosphatase family
MPQRPGPRRTDDGRGSTGAPRRLVRSDQLCRLKDAGRDALLAHGVRTVIDLRTPTEAAKDPDPLWHGQPVDYVLIPQQSEQLWRELDPIARTRAERDALVLDRQAVQIAAMARVIAHAAPGGVLIHCLAGKDRTGIAVALLLSLVGVDDAQTTHCRSRPSRPNSRRRSRLPRTRRRAHGSSVGMTRAPRRCSRRSRTCGSATAAPRRISRAPGSPPRTCGASANGCSTDRTVAKSSFVATSGV